MTHTSLSSGYISKTQRTWTHCKIPRTAVGAFSLVVESDDVTLTRCSPGKRTSVLESSSVILLSLSCCSVGVEFLAIHRVLSNWSVAIGRFRPQEAQGKVAERLLSVRNFWCIRRKTYGRQVKNKLHV